MFVPPRLLSTPQQFAVFVNSWALTSSSSSTAASYSVPATTTFPVAALTLTCVVIDASGLASTAVSYSATVAALTDPLRPFETGVNSAQVWYLDFSRDIEALSAATISGGATVNITAGANGLPDFDEILRSIGLNATSPIANVSGSKDSNQVTQDLLKARLLLDLATLHPSVNVSFTLTQPTGSFGTNPSVAYSAFGYSQISIAGSSTSPGILGIAIFDPKNESQDDNTRTDYQSSTRLGIFLHTIADAGLAPPASQPFRLTFDPLATILGGTAIGDDPSDGSRLLGTLTDSRATTIHAAINEFSRFIAVVLAHECGHSMGLVQNAAMPTGLYGNDTVNFPGSADGHIRNTSLFPSGATNIMSPALSYGSATHASTAFNTLNLAYLREQVFYGN